MRQVEDLLDLVERLVERVVLLHRRVRAVVLADRGGDELVRHEGGVVDRLADLRRRLDRARTLPDRDLAAVDGDDAVRAVEHRPPDAERTVVELDVAVGLLENHPHAELAAAAVEEVRRVRLVRADDLHWTGLVQVETPLGDVQVVGAPVAVVPRAQVVVKAPEHRIELVHPARRKLVRIRTPRRRPEPHVPVAVRVRRAFRRRVFGHVEEAHRVGRTAQLLPADAVVRVHVHDIADEAVAHDHAGGAEVAPAALHGAGLEDAPVLLLGGDDLLRLVDREGEGLFAVDVLAVLHRLHAHVGVPVVGRGDAHRVDRRVVQDFAEVVDRLARVLLVFLVHALGAGVGAHLVAVAHRDDFHVRRVVPPHELRRERRAHLDAVADQGQAVALARLELPRAGLRRGVAGQRDGRGGPEQEAAAVERDSRFHRIFPFICPKSSREKDREPDAARRLLCARQRRLHVLGSLCRSFFHRSFFYYYSILRPTIQLPDRAGHSARPIRTSRKKEPPRPPERGAGGGRDGRPAPARCP